MKQNKVEHPVVLSRPRSDHGLELTKHFGQRGLPLNFIGRDLGRTGRNQTMNNPNFHLIKFDLSKAMEVRSAKRLSEIAAEGLTITNPVEISFASNAEIINRIGSGIEGCVGSFPSNSVANYLAPALIAAACSKYGRENKVNLHILNVSSGAATKAIPGWATYCSTKASARMHFDVLNSERNSRITIDHFDPGVMDTQMQEEIRSSSIQSFPLQAEFDQLKVEGRLKSPLSAAIQIDEMISQ